MMAKVLGCGAQMDRLMDVSEQDVRRIEDFIGERVKRGMPQKKAQAMAVMDAMEALNAEKSSVMKAIEQQVVPQYNGRFMSIDDIDDLGAFNVDSYDFDQEEMSIKDELLDMGFGVAGRSIPTTDMTKVKKKDIDAAGLLPEKLYPKVEFAENDSGDLIANIKAGGTDRTARIVPYGLSGWRAYTAEMKISGNGAPLGPIGMSEERAKDWFTKVAAAADLTKRKFDLLNTVTAEAKERIANFWSKAGSRPDALEMPLDDDASGKPVEQLKKIAKQRLKGKGVTAEVEYHSGQLLVHMTKDGDAPETAMIEILRSVGGKQAVTLHTTGFAKGSGMGKLFYGIANAWAKQNGISVIADEQGLTHVNSVRRTENGLSSAARTGGEAHVLPGVAQRVYGFNEKAKTEGQKRDNLTRLALAQLRNVLEAAPELATLKYDPATDRFAPLTDDVQARLMVGNKVQRILEKPEVREVSIGRSSLARAALTQQLMTEEVALPKAFAKPVMYNTRSTLEYHDVEDLYKGTDQWMKAPNGKPTNLTERQWVQTRTPSFLNWFGDWTKYAGMEGGVWNDANGEVSKAVDENGEPLVLFHGTSKGGFMSFKQPGGKKRGDIGIFTTPDLGMAESYVRRGRAKRITAPENLNQAQLEDVGFQFDQTEDGIEVTDTDGYPLDGPADSDFLFRTMEEAVAEANKSFSEQDMPEQPGVYALFANIREPYESDFEGATWSGSREHQWIVEFAGEQQYDSEGKGYFDSKEEAAALAEIFRNPDDENFDPLDYVRGAEDHYEDTDSVAREGISNGDGAIIKNVIDDGGGPSAYGMEPATVFVLKDPEQVKSADFNSGEFGDVSDIRYNKRTKTIIGGFEFKDSKDGSATVMGDAEQIRSLLPTGIVGRKVGGGLVFTPSEAPQVKSALAGDKMTYSREGRVVEKLPMKDGKYVGAPEKFNKPGNIGRLRKILRDLTVEGAAGRFWYERSSEEILRMVGGDKREARKFVALLSIYSPQARVDANSTFATRAWAQYKMGQPINVKTGAQDREAQAALDDVEAFWSGEKTGNFYNNLLRMIDSSSDKQGATIDMWMMRAAQYSSDAPTATQYAFMENETNRIAQELGWEPQQVQAAIWVAMKARMESKGVKKATEETSEANGWIRFVPGKKGEVRDILDEQKHRDNWLKHAMQLDVSTQDTNQAKFDFADGLVANVGQVSWEPRPSTKLDILPGIHNAPYSQQLEFYQDVYKTLFDENGVDLLAQKLGLLIDGETQGPGVWESAVSAGGQRRMVMAPAKGGKMVRDFSNWSKITEDQAAAIDPNWKKNPQFKLVPSIDPEQEKLIQAYSAIVGLLLRQDGVGYHRPFYSANKADQNGVELRIGRPFSPEEAMQLWTEINTLMYDLGKPNWDTDAGLISSAEGMRVVNFGVMDDNKAFRDLVETAAAKVTALPDYGIDHFYSDGNLVSNNWLENENGESFVQTVNATGRSDVLGWSRTVLAPKVQAVFDSYAKKYGWGNPGKISYNTRDTLGFYSELSEQVGKSTMKQAAAPAWKTFIKALTQKGVKPDEIKWSGVEEWLDLQEGKVTKQQITDYLDANGVKVEEVVLGTSEKRARADELINSLDSNYGVEVDTYDNGEVVSARYDNRWYRNSQFDQLSDEDFYDELMELVAIPPKGPKNPEAKYGTYVLPGGENYREVLLTLPVKERGNKLTVIPVGSAGRYWSVFNETTQEDEGTYESKEEAQAAANAGNKALVNEPVGYSSSHWDQKNVLAHIRINDRTDADGQKLLFIEELQSDWQQAKRKGNDVPDAPFVKDTQSWLNLALKRIITMAAEGGYDKVAFTTGEQNAERFSLDKRVDGIYYTSNGDGTYNVSAAKGNSEVWANTRATEQVIEDTLGKEMAERIANGVGANEDGVLALRGADLKIEAKGMRSFYDTIVPNAVKALLKKVGGGQMRTIEIDSDPNKELDKWEAEDGEGDGSKAPVERLQQPGFDITPEMKQSVERGLPRYNTRTQLLDERLDVQPFLADLKAALKGRSPNQIDRVMGRVSDLRKKLDTVNEADFQDEMVSLGARAVKLVVDSDASMDDSTTIPVPIGATPHALGLLKLNMSPVRMDSRIIAKVLKDKHSEEFTKASPEEFVRAIYQPITIIQDANNSDEYEIATRLISEKTGLPITFVLKRDTMFMGQKTENGGKGKGLSAHAIMTAYSRNKTWPGGLRDAYRQGRLRYADVGAFEDLVNKNPALGRVMSSVGAFSKPVTPNVMASSAASESLPPSSSALNSTAERPNPSIGTARKSSSPAEASLLLKGIRQQVSSGMVYGFGDLVNHIANKYTKAGSQMPNYNTREELPAFKEWSEGLPVVGDGEYEGGAAVLRMYHGTTHNNIKVFKNTGSKEGALGQGPYFTTSSADASENYAGIGPDLTGRISREEEDLSNSFNDDDYAATEMLEEYLSSDEYTGDSIEVTDENLEDLKSEHGEKAIAYKAKLNLKGDSDGLMMPVYVKVKKPFDMRGYDGTVLTMDREYDEDGDPVGEESGDFIDLINAMDGVAGWYGANLGDFKDAVYSDALDGISAKDIFDAAAKHITDLYDDSGDMVSSGQFMQDALREAGYDSIIQPANAYFGRRKGFSGITLPGMKGLDDDTLHVVPFTANQVKSITGNNGEYSLTNDDINYNRRNGTSQWDEPIDSKWDDYVFKIQDKHIDLKRVIQDIQKWTGKLADDINVYLQEELYHGRTAKRVQDFARMELNPALEELAGYGMKLEDLEEYLHARHAKEANRVIAQRNPNEPGLQDGGSGMKDADADAYFRNLSAADKAKLDSVAQKFDAIMAETNRLMVSYELESQDAIDAWGRMFKHYVPLHREDKEGGRGTGQGFSIKGKETKGRTGSARKVVDIISHIAQARENTVVRGEKNRVSQALVGLVTAHPNQDFWKVGPPDYERVYNPKTGVVEERINPMYKNMANVVVSKALVNGKVQETVVTFNEDNARAVRMAGALKNLDAPKLEGWLGSVAKVTRYFSSINTQYNPVFGVVNLVRDIQGAMVNLGTTPLAGMKGRISKDAVRALAGIYKDIRATRKGGVATSAWSQLYEQFQEDGGQTGFRDLFATPADRTEELKSMIDPEGWAKSGLGKFFSADGRLVKPMNQIKKGSHLIFDWLSDYNEAMENGVRLAAYKAALDKGLSRQQAASIAKNLTVNFNRKGQFGSQAGAAYAFFNAAMQGTARIGEALMTMEPGQPKTLRLTPFGKKVVYGGMLIGSIQALALAAAGFGDDEPPDFVRERSLVIPIGGKDYISIPMPLGLHVIPNVGRIATEFALGGFVKPQQRVADLAGLFADAFNPIGNAGLSMQTLAPTVLDPLVALTENKDWTGKPIARTSFNKDVPGFSQHKDSATAISKFLAESINTLSGGNKYVAGVLSPTPDQIDYLAGQIGGGVYREWSKLEQTATNAITGEATPTYKIPLVGRFVGSASGPTGESGMFYANAQKLNRLETEIKGLENDGKRQEAAELRRKPEALLIAQANAIERQVQKLRKEKSALVNAGAPREQVRAVEERITQSMAKLNRAVEARTAR